MYKIYFKGPGMSKGHTSKLWLIMRLITIILIASFMQVYAVGFAQKISINQSNAPLKTILKELRLQSGYNFVYTDDLLSMAKPIDIKVNEAKFEDVLVEVFKDQPLTYTVHKNTITVKEKDIILSRGILNGNRDIVIRGIITDSKGETLPGVSVKLKGSTMGATTDLDGRYTINVADKNSILVFTYIGYISQEVIVGDRTALNVKLEIANTALTEVVVTALGISREKKGLVYAVTEVKGSEFTQSRENNVANALVGKVAGVDVSGMATGPGGSSRVVIRGNGSFNGNNQPLYVINGMPMSNTHREAVPGSGSILDQGDGISSINPDDIESISILKGGPAAALYGSQAANGVILITTKKGVIRQGIGVEISSNFTSGMPTMYPDFQYTYGQGRFGVKPPTLDEAMQSGRLSFGGKMDGQPYIQFDGVMRPYSPVNVKDNFKNFYRPATNRTNTVAFTGGSSSSLVYRLSLSDLGAKSLQPGSTYRRQTASLNMRSVLGKKGKMIVESTIQYNLDKGKNRPGNGYADNSTSFALNLLANTVDVRTLAPGYDELGNETMWSPSATSQNPYFVISKNKNADAKNRFIGQASIQYNILDDLFLKVSGSRDIDRFEQMSSMPYGTALVPLGTYFSGTHFATETLGQALLNYNREFLKDFHFNAMGGGSLEKKVFESTTHNGSDYIVPNFTSFNNLAVQSTSIGFNQMGQNSLFASADIDYKKIIFLTFTGRQDWFSVLNPGNNSIFYPSGGASLILSEALKLPSVINFAKLRASWAQVGSATVNPYQINTSYGFLGGGFQGLPVQTTATQLANPNLKPLLSTTTEVGLNIEFFNSRLGTDITLYDRKTTDDILGVGVAPTSGYTTALLNSGSISNKGIELLLTGQPINSQNFKWNVSYNAAYNKSEILKLAPGLTSVNGSQVGQPYDTRLDRTYVTNSQGQTVYNRVSGYPVLGPLLPIGQGVAPYIMGITNNFKYKNFSLNVLIDGKFGNIVESQLSSYMHRFGLSKNTLPGRENGLTVSGVDEAGNPFTKTWPVNQLATYYNNAVNYSPATLTTFDGSFIKLRSVIVDYEVPVNKLKFKGIESVHLSLVARNLAILYTKITDFDPESAYRIGNSQVRVSNTIPRTRDIGVNLTVKF